MSTDWVSFTELLSKIVDNRGRTCPTAITGLPLIATNCVRNELLYPAFDNVRYVDADTYGTWFRGHPEPGDLVFVCKGSPGRVCMVPDPVTFCIAQDMVAVRPNPKKIYPKYLFAALRSSNVQAQIGNMHVGTLIPHFKKGDFNRLLIPVPDKRLQKVIGDLYFELSAKIDVNRRMNATLEEMARATFKSWFVDFDPVRAKLDGRRHAGVDDTVAALFSGGFQMSEVGAVPEGWLCGTISSIGKRVIDRVAKPESWADEPLIDLSRMPQRSIALADWGRGEELKTAVTRFMTRDTLFGAIRPYFHKVGIAPTQGVTNISVFVIRAVHSFDWAYLVAVCASDSTVEFATRVAKGTKMPVVGWPDFANQKIAVPPVELRQAFGRVVGSYYDLIVANIHQSRTLAALRDTLLHKLLDEQLCISDAVKTIEEAA